MLKTGECYLYSSDDCKIGNTKINIFLESDQIDAPDGSYNFFGDHEKKFLAAKDIEVKRYDKDISYMKDLGLSAIRANYFCDVNDNRIKVTDKLSIIVYLNKKIKATDFPMILEKLEQLTTGVTSEMDLIILDDTDEKIEEFDLAPDQDYARKFIKIVELLGEKKLVYDDELNTLTNNLGCLHFK